MRVAATAALALLAGLTPPAALKAAGAAPAALKAAAAAPAALKAAAAPRAGGFGPEHLPAVRDGDDPLVDAAPLVPGLLVQLAYATPRNLAGRALYPPGARCLLRRSVAERLALAARALAKVHLRLVAWDCTRPAAAQEALWKAHPVPGAVADPARGSLHARGVAIDVAVAGEDGSAAALPTAFDEFGRRAWADAALPPGAARANRDALEAAMRAAGFRVNPKEWWHYSRLWGYRWPVVPEGTARY